MTWPELTSLRTTVLPYWSVVVTSGKSLLEAPEVTGTAASVMTDPLFPTFTLATGDVEITVEPRELVVVTITPGKREAVVMVDPRELVVVKVCSTLTEAEASKAEVVITVLLPSAFVVESTTGISTPLTTVEDALFSDEAVPAVIAAGVLVMVLPTELVVVTGAASVAEPADDTTTDDSTVLPSELVVVTATVVGVMEVISPVDIDAADESVVDPTSDELRPEGETTPEDVTEAPEADEPDDTMLELSSTEEDTEDELDPREEAAEEAAEEADSTEEEGSDEEVAVTEAEESALDGSGEADREDTLLLSPVEVLVALVSAVDSVVKETAVVDESDIMTGTVEVAESVSEAVVVPFVVCLFLNSALTTTSCFAISTSRDARLGLSLWICSIARSSASKTPFLYLGPRCPWSAAWSDSEGRRSSSCLKSSTFEKSRRDSLGSGWLCATAMYMHWRPTTRRDRTDGMSTGDAGARTSRGRGRC